MPHSKPAATSRTSSLNRRSEVIVPFQMIAPSRRKRTLEPLVIAPVADEAPAIAPIARHAEDLADLGLAGDDLFELRGEQAEHGGLDVLDQLVDDLVGPDLDVLVLGQLPRAAVGADVEADDRRVRGLGELDVVLGDAADAAVHERELHVVALELAQALGDASSEPCTSAFSTRLSVAVSPRWSCSKRSSSRAPPAATIGWCPVSRTRCARASPSVRAFAEVAGDAHLVAGLRGLGEPEHLHGRRRPGHLDRLAAVVHERLDLAPRRAGDDRRRRPPRVPLGR